MRQMKMRRFDPLHLFFPRRSRPPAVVAPLGKMKRLRPIERAADDDFLPRREIRSPAKRPRQKKAAFFLMGKDRLVKPPRQPVKRAGV